MKKETIIIFGAHSDDEILAAGGTIKKYSLEGKKIISVTFHTGGVSHKRKNKRNKKDTQNGRSVKDNTFRSTRIQEKKRV